MKVEIGGIVPFTCLDFPGKLAAVVFTQSCSLRCKYCHNKHLWDVKKGTVSIDEFKNFLKSRIDLLEGIVFSGGEPFMHEGIIELMQYTKSLGFEIGVHTSGIFVEKLKKSLEFVDWVGLDIKALQKDYETITGIPNSGEKAYESLDNLISSNVDYEIRTTVWPKFFTREKLLELINFIETKKVKKFVLQEYRPIEKNEIPISLSKLITEEELKNFKTNILIRK